MTSDGCLVKKKKQMTKSGKKGGARRTKKNLYHSFISSVVKVVSFCFIGCEFESFFPVRDKRERSKKKKPNATELSRIDLEKRGGTEYHFKL